MKKFFSLVLALVMALSLTTVAWGAPVTTATDLKTALEGSGEVVLANDVTLNGEVSIINVTGDVTLTATSPVTIDASGVSEPFNVTGKLTIGANVTITTDTYLVGVYGGEVVVNAGAKITSTSATHCAFDVSTGGKMTVNEGSEITGVGSMIGVTGGTLNIMGGTVSCNTAFAAAFAYAGTINVYGGEVKNGQDPADSCALIAAGDTAVVNVYGGIVESVLAHVYAGSKVNIEGGTITKDVSAKDGGSVAISGGTVVGDVIENTGSTVTVSGGRFPNADVTDYLASGVSVKPDGTVAATASFSGTANITTKFSEEGTYYVLNASNVWEKVEYVPAEDNGDGTGNVAYFEGTSGTTYIICKKNDDDALKLTSGFLAGDKLLNYVKVSEVEYEATATAVNASLYATCTTDINAKGYKVVDAYGAVTYYKDPATGVTPTNWLLVGKEIKGVVPQVEVTDYVMGGHALIQNRAAWLDEAETIHEYKCVICGTKFNGTTTKAAGVTYVPYFEPNAATKTAYTTAGYDMSDVDTGNLWLISTKVPSGGAATTDKVTSAETFDAGIAMYVGMSVMAAAGSAVVIGKKKD